MVLVLLIVIAVGVRADEEVNDKGWEPPAYYFKVDDLLWEYRGVMFKDFTELIRMVNKEIALTKEEHED